MHKRGSKYSVRQLDKDDQCVVSLAHPRGYITTVRKIRHYKNGCETGMTDAGKRVVRESKDHAWFESFNKEVYHGNRYSKVYN